MFFIDNYKPQVLHWRKHRRARAEDDARFAASHPPPSLVPLVLAEGGVQHRHQRAEPRQELPLHGRGQGDLRHQHQRRTALLQAARHQAQIDFCLPARRHSVQERGMKLATVEPALQLLKNARLGRSEIDLRRPFTGGRLQRGEGRLAQFDETVALELAEMFQARP